MSKGQISRTVKFVHKNGTYTSMLQCSKGQLWQSYAGLPLSPTNVTPDYDTMVDKPVIYFVCVSSRTRASNALVSTPAWYFGNHCINSDNANAIDSAYSQYFELVMPNVANGQNYYGLRIKKNLVALAQGSSVNIKAVGTISGAGFQDEVHAETVINIYPQNGEGAQIDIVDVTNVGGGVIGRNFTFDEENQNITMKVESYVGSIRQDESAAQISSNVITYQWQRILNGAWVNVATGGTNQTLTVNEQDVTTYAKYRCRVEKGGKLLGYGTANLMDSTDPYVIDPNPTPLDETLEDEGDTVVYNPRIVSRRNPGVVASGFQNAKFNFVLLTSGGVDITPQSGYTNVSSGTVTYVMGENYGNIGVVIETVDDLDDW